MNAISSCCTQLIDLDVSFSNFDFPCIRKLLQNCPNLRRLNVADNPNSEPSAFSIMSSMAPKLIICTTGTVHFPTRIPTVLNRGTDLVSFSMPDSELDVVSVKVNKMLLQKLVKQVESHFDHALAG
jgi:hypothetical protein